MSGTLVCILVHAAEKCVPFSNILIGGLSPNTNLYVHLSHFRGEVWFGHKRNRGTCEHRDKALVENVFLHPSKGFTQKRTPLKTIKRADSSDYTIMGFEINCQIRCISSCAFAPLRLRCYFDVWQNCLCLSGLTLISPQTHIIIERARIASLWYIRCDNDRQNGDRVSFTQIYPDVPILLSASSSHPSSPQISSIIAASQTTLIEVRLNNSMLSLSPSRGGSKTTNSTGWPH